MTELPRHCQCDNCSGIDCGQDDPDRYLKQKIQDEERHDKEVRQDERDKIYKRLEAMTTEAGLITCVTWADIDCLFDELKSGEPK